MDQPNHPKQPEGKETENEVGEVECSRKLIRVTWDWVRVHDSIVKDGGVRVNPEVAN